MLRERGVHVRPPRSFRSFRSGGALAAVLLMLVLTLAACPTPKSPEGPAPEYEDPPGPSWLEGGLDGGGGPG